MMLTGNETQRNLINIRKCNKRKYTDYTIDNALYIMRNRAVSKTHVLNKVRCLECKAFHIVRERRIK